MSRKPKKPAANPYGGEHRFTQRLSLYCPQDTRHTIGWLYRDTIRRTTGTMNESAHLELIKMDPPVIAWRCPTCRGATRAYPAEPLLDLMDAMRLRGPHRASVVLTPHAVAEKTRRLHEAQP